MKRLACLLVLVAGFLAACSQNQGAELEPLAINLSQLVRLSGGNFLTSDRNCLVNSFEMPGQGFRVNTKPQDGGLSYEPFTEKSKTAFTIGTELKNTFFSNPSVNQFDTAILVVDDFGTLGSEVYKLGNALFTQREFTATTIETLQDGGVLFHGTLVNRHISEVIRGTKLYSFDNIASSPDRQVYRSNLANPIKLEVISVNVDLSQQRDTAFVASKIESKINELLMQQSTLKIVINMSFALMPCGVYNDFVIWDGQTLGEQTFEDYVRALFNKNVRLGNIEPPDTRGDLVNAIIDSTNSPTDPLKKLINGTDFSCPFLCSAQHNIYVASAGNYSLDREMNPAGWNGVVNVTGSSVDDPTTRATEYFNRGEVMHLAASLKLNPPRFLIRGKPLYYIGTSFSAPTVSVYSALDRAMTQRCTDGVNSLSELAKNLPALTDVPLEDMPDKLGAVSKRCGAN
jgi:predicted transport protein